MNCMHDVYTLCEYLHVLISYTFHNAFLSWWQTGGSPKKQECHSMPVPLRKKKMKQKERRNNPRSTYSAQPEGPSAKRQLNWPCHSQLNLRTSCWHGRWVRKSANKDKKAPPHREGTHAKKEVLERGEKLRVLEKHCMWCDARQGKKKKERKTLG